MKKKFSKILGVGLAIALVTSLLMMAAPASAYPLLWYPDSAVPSRTGNVLGPAGINIIDLAVSGNTAFAATGDNTTPLYKSTDGGATWADMATTTYFPAGKAVKLVTMAADDTNVVTIVTTDEYVYYSSTGGSVWTNLGLVASGAHVNAIDISNGPYRFIAAAGDDGTDAELYVIFLAMAQGWWSKRSGALGSSVGAASNMTALYAVKFSPNYAVDNIITAVSGNGTDAYFELFRDTYGAYRWNGQIAYLDSEEATAWGSGILLDTGTYAGGSINGTLSAADIALPSTYLGNDAGSRIAFVSWAGTGTNTVGNISSLTDSVKTDFRTWSSADEGPITNIAYNESTDDLLAGDYNNHQVYVFLSPLSSTPKAERVNSLKQPAGDNKTLVAWSGTNAVAATFGDESAFAISTDNGYSFNDISLIDTVLSGGSNSGVDDIAVSADGSTVYLSTHNGTDTSIWLRASAWKRIFSTDTGSTTSAAFLIRLAPENASAVYISSNGTTNMWVSKNSGMTSWKSNPVFTLTKIQDFVVQSADVVYAIDAAGLSKTVNAGASWGTKVTPADAFEPYMITLAPNGDILIGGIGYVAYSKDSGTTLTRTLVLPYSSTSSAQVVADKDYATNNIIFVGAGAYIYRGAADTTTIPSAAATATITSGQSVVGMARNEGVIYALSANTTATSTLHRALNLTTAASSAKALWSSVATTYGGVLNKTPQALRMSAGPTFWAVGSSANLASFSDPIALTAPTLNSPAEATQITLNEMIGKAYDITFSWNRPAGDYVGLVSAFDLQIATDTSFDALVYTGNFAGVTTDITAKIIGPTAGVDAQVASFMPGFTYYWRVRVSATGPMYSPWSETRSFTVGSKAVPVVPIAEVAIVTPISGATVSIEPTLVWTAYEGAIRYEIMVSTEDDFSIIEYSHSVPVANTFYKSETLAYDTTYYWRVRGITGEQENPYVPAPGSAWATGIFTTEAKPVPVVVEKAEQVIIVQKEPAPPPEIVRVEVPVPIPAEPQAIPNYLLWTIIGIGSALIVSLVVLIARTRRVT